MNIKPISTILFMMMSITACSDNEYEAYRSGIEEPYVVIEGCKFWIYTNSGSAAVGAPKVDNDSQVTTTYSVTSGEYMIKARDCKIVENYSNLKIYKK